MIQRHNHKHYNMITKFNLYGNKDDEIIFNLNKEKTMLFIKKKHDRSQYVDLVREDLLMILKLFDTEYVYFKQKYTEMTLQEHYLEIKINKNIIRIKDTLYDKLKSEINNALDYVENYAHFVYKGNYYKDSILLKKTEKKVKDFNL